MCLCVRAQHVICGRIERRDCHRSTPCALLPCLCTRTPAREQIDRCLLAWRANTHAFAAPDNHHPIRSACPVWTVRAKRSPPEESARIASTAVHPHASARADPADEKLVARRRTRTTSRFLPYPDRSAGPSRGGGAHPQCRLPLPVRKPRAGCRVTAAKLLAKGAVYTTRKKRNAPAYRYTAERVHTTADSRALR